MVSLHPLPVVAFSFRGKMEDPFSLPFPKGVASYPSLIPHGYPVVEGTRRS